MLTESIHQTDANEVVLAQEPPHIIKHLIHTRREIRDPGSFVPLLQKMKLKSAISLLTDTLEYELDLSDDKVHILAKIMRSTKYLPLLHIKADESDRITDRGLRVLLSHLYHVKSLSKLVLDFSRRDLTTDDLLFLSQSLRDLRSLKVLHLSICYNGTTEDGLKALSHSLKSLRLMSDLTLNLSRCDNVTDQEYNKHL